MSDVHAPEDQLLNRLACCEPRESPDDREAGCCDGEVWAELDQLAAVDDSLWRRVARSLHQELKMRSELSDALNDCCDDDLRDCCNAAFSRDAAGRPAHHSPRRQKPFPFRQLSGWAAAAVVALAWIGLSLGENALPEPLREVVRRDQPDHNSSSTRQTAEPLRLESSDQAYQQFVALGSKEGRILEELPKILLQHRYVEETGELEVIFVRQILERATVREAFQLQTDEHGQPQPVEINLASLRDESSL